MLCKHHFSKNGQVFFHIFWVVTLIMQSREATLFIAVEKRKLSRVIQNLKIAGGHITNIILSVQYNFLGSSILMKLIFVLLITKASLRS
ncbi:hypothetical protein EFP34_14185 [Lacticaseibacillus paracasei]|nr:hypothetical protein [Lacticaseibacillus paracasei]